MTSDATRVNHEVLEVFNVHEAQMERLSSYETPKLSLLISLRPYHFGMRA